MKREKLVKDIEQLEPNAFSTYPSDDFGIQKLKNLRKALEMFNKLTTVQQSRVLKDFGYETVIDSITTEFTADHDFLYSWYEFEFENENNRDKFLKIINLPKFFETNPVEDVTTENLYEMAEILLLFDILENKSEYLKGKTIEEKLEEDLIDTWMDLKQIVIEENQNKILETYPDMQFEKMSAYEAYYLNQALNAWTNYENKQAYLEETGRKDIYEVAERLTSIQSCKDFINKLKQGVFNPKGNMYLYPIRVQD